MEDPSGIEVRMDLKNDLFGWVKHGFFVPFFTTMKPKYVRISYIKEIILAMEIRPNHKNEKEYRTPVSIFDAIRSVKEAAEEKASPGEKPAEEKNPESIKVRENLLFPFV